MNEFIFAIKLMITSVVIVFALQFKMSGSTLEQKTYLALVQSGFARDVQIGTQRILNVLGEKLERAGEVIATKSEQIKRSRRSQVHQSLEENQ